MPLQTVERRNPSKWEEVLARVPVAGQREVARAVAAAGVAQARWRTESPASRAALLLRWADALAARSSSLAEFLALEIGKPLADGREEIGRAVAHIRASAGLLEAPLAESLDEARAVSTRYRPHGVVGVITPWNNPAAIPAGKIAPALAFGNAVVWKPAIEAPRSAQALMETLAQAAMPAGLVGLVTGEAATARRLAKHPGVAAVTLTGSVATGRSAALLCARLGKPLQAELGGNNAAIILADCPVRDEARSLALAAFSFAGQRCTAIRRFIVERPVLDEFREVFVTAVESLRLGDPRDSLTEIGPLISRAAVERIQSLLSRAAAGGAAVLCGGKTPPGLEQGCWLTPAVVSGAAPDSEIVRSETFGPVAVILPADDLEDALAIANSVEHGLVASLHTGDDRARCRFCEAAEAGILKLASGPLAVHPDAPFGGWKASGFGPPEHGLWDRAFYTRPQAVYGWSERAD